MTSIGRNDRCPCGSGKKYKKCCLPEQEESARIAMRAEQQRAMERALLQVTSGRRPQHHHEHVPQDMGVVPAGIDGYALDELANGVLDLIRQGRLHEALVGCQRLLDEFPGVPDGFEMSAMAHDELGNHALAAEHWRKLLDFVAQPSQRPHYDPDLIAAWTRSHDRSRQAAEAQAARPADPDRAP